MSEENQDNLVVWSVKDGPYHRNDLKEEYQPVSPVPQAFLVLMMSPEGKPDEWFDHEVWFASLDDAYDYKKHIDQAVEPVPLVGAYLG